MTRRDNQYLTFAKLIVAYWGCHGGWGGMLLSPLLHIATLFTLITYPMWKSGESAFIWFDLTITVIPNMLGFTLAAYTALMAFGHKRFIETMSGNYPDGDYSPFLKTSAAFIHFIIIQMLALIIAIISKSFQTKNEYLGVVGVLLLFYALLTGIGASFAVFDFTRLFDRFIKDHEKNGGDDRR